jgi:hypothetical protein
MLASLSACAIRIDGPEHAQLTAFLPERLSASLVLFHYFDDQVQVMKYSLKGKRPHFCREEGHDAN